MDFPEEASPIFTYDLEFLGVLFDDNIPANRREWETKPNLNRKKIILVESLFASGFCFSAALGPEPGGINPCGLCVPSLHSMLKDGKIQESGRMLETYLNS